MAEMAVNVVGGNSKAVTFVEAGKQQVNRPVRRKRRAEHELLAPTITPKLSIQIGRAWSVKTAKTQGTLMVIRGRLDSGGPESGAGSKTDEHFAHAKVVSNELLIQNDSLVDENRGVSSMQEGNLDNTYWKIVGPHHIMKDGNKELAHTDSSLLSSNLEQQSIVKRVFCKEQQIGLKKDGKSNPWPEEVTGNMGKRREAEIREPKRNMVDYNSEIFTRGTNIKSPKLNGYRCKPKKDADVPSERKRPAPQAKERRESKKMCDSQDKFEAFVPEKPMEPLKIKGIDCKLEMLRTINQGTGVKNSCDPEVCPENLPSAGVVSAETISQNKENASAEKDADVPSERKRPAPQAKERRESKKMCASQDKFESVVPKKPMEHLKTEGYDCKLESVRNKNQGSGVKNSDDPEVCPENLPSAGVVSAETFSQNKENASAEKGDDVPEKKRKQVLTKERKAKKKQKAKMKLAEKNVRPAVKRPQLQPVVKQKPVAPCRHYLHGRCKEGALCKFSHDTIPLTKSTPCSHFARHSCMKGDQCPFDHELSKYPCNNFQTKGSCSRGVNCLFSHKIQVSESASSSDVKATGPDLLALSLLDKSSSLNQFILYKKLDAKSSPSTLSPCTNTKLNSTLTTPIPSTETPKGMESKLTVMLVKVVVEVTPTLTFVQTMIFLLLLSR